MKRQTSSWTKGAAVLASLLMAGAAWSAVTIQTVVVGDPGNAGEWSGQGYGGGYGPARKCGAVAYQYQIGKYDVTAAQYTEFLNAVAKTDTYGLYNPLMAGGYAACGITRSGSSGNYSYGVDVIHADFPVNYLTCADAARFANWLTNGQPTGAQGLATTEDGSYYLNGTPTAGPQIIPPRKTNARFVVPTEDEWYKAAYYKGGGTNAGYWVYPTQSNTPPSNVLSATGTNNANFNIYSNGGAGGFTEPLHYLTPVGAFAASPSAYGTFDQGGNVWQWYESTESVVNLGGQRGGAFHYDSYFLTAATRGGYPPGESPMIGFRVAVVPEPASAAILALSGMALLMRRRERCPQ